MTSELLPENGITKEQNTALTVVQPSLVSLAIKALNRLTNWFPSKFSDDQDACMLEEYKNHETGEVFKVWPPEKQMKFNALAEFVSRNPVSNDFYTYTARKIHSGIHAGEWVIFRQSNADSALDQFANAIN